MRFSQDQIRFDAYELDPSQGLRLGAGEVHLTPKSLQILVLLARRAGQIVSKEELFREVWGAVSVSDSALTTCIRELRRALGDDAREPRFIETVHRRGFRFVAPLSGREHPEVPSGLGEPPPLVVGRESVIGELRDVFAAAQHGRRQVVFITGEAGIGKTTVVRSFLNQTQRSTWGQCIEHYGAGEPYEPLLDALTRLCRRPDQDHVIASLRKYAPSWVAQLPDLASGGPLLPTSRERMLRELTDAMEAIAVSEPLVLVIEDLHWSDPSTLDWISAFSQRPDRAHVLIICTSRPPVSDRIDTVRIKQVFREIRLTGWTQTAVAEYAALRYPGEAASLATLIHQRTDGNPLFVANVLDDLTARGLLTDSEGRWLVTAPLTALDLEVPDDLRRTIQTQFHRLAAEEMEILKVASVAGTKFSLQTVGSVVGIERHEAESMLTRLAREQRFVRRSGTETTPDGRPRDVFEFLHALYRDVIYDDVTGGRRADLHRLIGEAEEAAYGDHASEIAAELAMHFEQVPDVDRAIMYRRHAAESARRRSALAEAQMHFERALTLVDSQPAPSRRNEHEIALRIGLGGVIMSSEGWGAAGAAEEYSKALALCHQLDDAPRLFPALWGLWLFYWGRGPLSMAQRLAEDLLRRARRSGDRQQILQAHHACWASAFSRGDLDATIEHADEGMRLYEGASDAGLAAVYGNHDAGSCARSFAARAYALQGDAVSARVAGAESMALAVESGDAFSLALSHVFSAATAQALGDQQTAGASATAGAAIAGQQDFRLIHAWATVYEGWSAGNAGRMEQGIAEARSTGSHQFMEHFLGLLADVYFESGRPDRGQRVLEEAEIVLSQMETSFHEPELRRLRGEHPRGTRSTVLRRV